MSLKMGWGMFLKNTPSSGVMILTNHNYGGWEPTIPLIRLPGRAETASPRKGKHKAHSLIDKVYNEMNLYRAWRKVRANKGTHGLDRVTIRMFETDLDTHLREIQRKLKEHRFEPQPVLRVYIPKPADPKKRRPLGIPVVTDRIVQQAIVQVVEPLFDAQMSTRSYGYRKVARRTMPSPLLSRMRKRDYVSS